MGCAGEISMRQHAVVDALWTAVLTVGGQANREPKGLASDRQLRPDLQIVFPGQHLLTDVAIAHPLTVARCATGVAMRRNAGVARN